MTEREKMQYVVDNDGRCHCLSCDGCPINYLQGCENDIVSLKLAKQWLADQPETPAKPAPDPRRYEIAKVVMAGFAACPKTYPAELDKIAQSAIRWADALIAELDKTEAAK